MSSGPAGKFQDHYIVLGVEPSADSETIQSAYSKLAQKLHPNNAETGNKEKFDALNLAFEVLSDAGLRASFDQVKGIDRDAGAPKFAGSEFFRALEHGANVRAAMLCLLYDRRRVKPTKPTLSLKQIEAMLDVTQEELSLALWYLKQRGMVTTDDKSTMQISVDGIDHLETNRPDEEAVMRVLRREALAVPSQPEKPAEPKTGEVLSALSRALNKSSDEVLRRVQARVK